MIAGGVPGSGRLRGQTVACCDLLVESSEPTGDVVEVVI
jgi:hypothetical protein